MKIIPKIAEYTEGSPSKKNEGSELWILWKIETKKARLGLI
jgi:hypothetical protein